MSESEAVALPGEGASMPSATVRALIRLSDWILLANTARTAVAPAVLDEIYRQVTEILTQAGCILLNAEGPCDYERQMIVGTQETDNPELDEHIYSTVRPGYLFHQQLLRPQEVILYEHKQA